MAYLYQNRNITGDDDDDNDLMMIMMTLMLDAYFFDRFYFRIIELNFRWHLNIECEKRTKWI